MNRFRFKDFEIEHRQSTMKVGTDAVLLGAWTDIPDNAEALDIGTGCGVIAMILANRSRSVHVTAIDSDEASVVEAAGNFESGPWPGRLRAVNQSFQDFAVQTHLKFNLIVSNPPWFNNCLRVPGNQRRNNARHSDTLDFNELIDLSVSVSAPGAVISLVLPMKEGILFTRSSLDAGFNLQRRCIVFPRAGKQPHRQLLQFGLTGTVCTEETELLIHDDAGRFTDAYRELTGMFYLNF